MGIRENLNKNPAMTTGVTAGILLLAIIIIVWQLWPRSADGGQTRAFFTTDNGQTWFEDDIFKIPPFMHQGKEAVRAHVYQAGENGKPFVGWMQKYIPQAKQRLDQILADPAKRRTYIPEMFEEQYQLVKTPKMPDWMPASFDIINQLRMIQAPEGMAREIFPNSDD